MNEMMNLLGGSALRAPRRILAVVLLALIALAATLTYSGSLVVGVVGDYLDVSRFLAGLLLGLLFLRLPSVRNGRLSSIGLLPAGARQPVMIGLLALCLLTFLYRGEMIPVLFIGGALTFALSYKWLRQALLNRALKAFLGTSPMPSRPTTARRNSDDIIDVEFREKKD